MKRLLPSPQLSLGLFLLWLLLNQSLSLGHLLLAVLVAVVIPKLMAPLRPVGGSLRRPGVLLRLIAVVGFDVVVSGLSIGQGVLGSRRRMPQGRFVIVPLALRDVHALAALAMITAVVPGTVWSELAPDRSALLLHVFDLPGAGQAGEAAFIARFKHRYERPLLEIFE
jgi:multicomponent K+:H+ antiporter subunit E